MLSIFQSFYIILIKHSASGIFPFEFFFFLVVAFSFSLKESF